MDEQEKKKMKNYVLLAIDLLHLSQYVEPVAIIS